MNYFLFQLLNLFRGSYWESYLIVILGLNCLIEILINPFVILVFISYLSLDIKEDIYCLIMLEQFLGYDENATNNSI